MSRKYLTEREFVALVGEDATRDDYNRLNGPLNVCREVMETHPSYSLVCSLPENHGGDHSAEGNDDTRSNRLAGGRRR